MLPAVLKKYNSTKHSSTKLTPNEAHDDKNHMDVKVNFTRREKNTRKYEEIKETDTVKIFTKGRGNYTDRKERLQSQEDRIPHDGKQNFPTGRID